MRRELAGGGRPLPAQPRLAVTGRCHVSCSWSAVRGALSLQPMPLAISIDGAPTLPEHARVSIFDRGFLFGDGVFEVLRTYEGAPLGLGAHLRRLERSARALGIELPIALEALGRETAEVIARAAEPDLYVRIIVTRGTGPLHLDPSAARSPLRVVVAAPLLPQPEGLHDRGVTMATVRAHRAADATPASAAKCSAYVGNMLAYVEAKRRGAYEALFVGEAGELLEGHSSSFFVVRGGTVRTPPLSLGILPGITRDVVRVACAEEGIPFEERLLFSHDALAADEAFLTSSLREVLPVVGLDGQAIGAGVPGPVSRRLRARYAELVRRGAVDALLGAG